MGFTRFVHAVRTSLWLIPLLCVLAGVLIMGILRNGLNINNVSAFWQQILIGLVIIVAVYIDVLRRRAAVRR